MQPENKGNDYAIEALKQLITLASAILALTITFLKDVIGDARGDARFVWLMPVAWLMLLWAVWFGWVTIADAAKAVGNSAEPIYAFGETTGTRRYARRAQWGFWGALVVLVAFGSLNLSAVFGPSPPKLPDVIARELAELRATISQEELQRADMNTKLVQLEFEQRRLVAALETLRTNTTRTTTGKKTSRKR